MIWLLSCGPTVAHDDATTQPETTGLPPATMTTGPDDEEDSGTCNRLDRCIDLGAPPPLDPADAVDILLVIDNSVSMVHEQFNIGPNLLRIMHRLQTMTDATGGPLDLDVHLMVTTTDRGGPLCETVDGYA